MINHVIEQMIMKKLIEKYNDSPIQIKASVWFLVCAFLQKGISMVTTPIFTRLLSTSEYGNYNVFNSWLNIVAIFVSLNLSYGVFTQGLVKYEDDRKRFASSMQGLSMLLVMLWALIYLAFHNFWNNLFSLTTVQMLAMLLMIWTSAVFNFWAAEQRVLYKYRMLVVITLIVAIAKPIIGIIFVTIATDKVTARIFGLVLVELVAYMGLYCVQLDRGKQFFNKKYWIYALNYNIPLVPHYLSQTVLNSSDRIMISSMAGNDEAGIYSLAYSISLIMTLFNTALMQTISPWIYQKIKNHRVADIKKVAYSTLIVIAVVNLVLILMAPEVVVIFAPPSYYKAIWIIPPVAMSVYFMYAYDLFAKFAFYYEKTKMIMCASVIGAVLNIVLNFICIKKFGFIAAGYTTLICYMVYSIAHYCFMNHVCRKYGDGERPYDIRVLLKITLLFMLCAFALLSTYNYSAIRYAIFVIILIIVVLKRKKLIQIVKYIVKCR